MFSVVFFKLLILKHTVIFSAYLLTTGLTQVRQSPCEDWENEAAVSYSHQEAFA